MALTQQVKHAIDKNDVGALREIFEHLPEGSTPSDVLYEMHVPVVRGPPKEQVRTTGSLLFYAVQKKAPEIVRYFVEEVGADPLQKTSDDSGNPIQQAALLQDKELLHILYNAYPSQRYKQNALASIQEGFFFYQVNKDAPDKDLIDFLLSNGIDLVSPKYIRKSLTPETLEWIASFPERSQSVTTAMEKKNIPQDAESIIKRFAALQGGRRRKTRRRKTKRL